MREKIKQILDEFDFYEVSCIGTIYDEVWVEQNDNSFIFKVDVDEIVSVQFYDNGKMIDLSQDEIDYALTIIDKQEIIDKSNEVFKGWCKVYGL